jgi:hypothetical protein
MADPTSWQANSPRAWPDIRNEVRHLERLHCAVQRQGGVSWDALASFYGVSKQAVHRRLSKEVDAVVENAQKYVDVHEDDVRHGTYFVAVAPRLSAEEVLLSAELQASVWNQRRRVSAWWWSEDS